MKDEKEKSGVRNADAGAGQMRSEFGDVNSKEIWKNALLCAQFLRGYAKVPILADVQPEDIEDITEALRPFVGVEYEGDAVKKIHLHEDGREVFVVGLLEHKSDVDYDVTFQLLKYMTGIWTMFRNRADREKPHASRSKDFRYPLIIPIVYYEGRDNWTADMHWRDRVEFSEAFGKYVPDFTYEVVGLRSYSDAELLSKEEELSLVMLLNRVQTEEDLDFGKWSREQREVVEKILRNAPGDVLRILSQMVYHFGLKMKLPDEKVQKYVRNIEERDMGVLWANMDDIDIPKRMRELDEKIEQAQRDCEQAHAERIKIQEEAERMREEHERMQVQNERMREETERMREETERMREETERMREETERMREEAEQMRAELAEKNAEIERLKRNSARK